ncbi:acyltransferase family protein [Gymnodinialimonas ceratoperidinii]|uniref:Acyltransferase family protein n=1 Tax=Gymnodinialimonas ceratoperidinii TaxID=2856823 RepID=A0A8F6TXC6_9RHOB|nr:acyltransferase family protein [Gymnodinialimonas ceratoperidinii]QXT39663.1 acyltransferase family protein [Gymnodinialimonas ceratoperidinii]
MTRGLSIWLDALRVAATLIVVLSHLAYPRFTGTQYAYLRDWNVGSDAVIVFFVVSGLVIAFAADRDRTLGRFTFNRLTRLWTVLLPALLLTLAFDAIGLRLDPAAYPYPFYQPQEWGTILMRGVSFSNEWTGIGRLRLGTNGPLWSLSYEAAYYLMFAVAMFTTGARRALLLLVSIMLVGLNVLLLAPAWLCGVWLWRRIASDELTALRGTTRWCLALLGPVAYLACQATGVPEILSTATAQALGVPDARIVLGFSDEVIWNTLIALFTTVHLVGVVAITRRAQAADSGAGTTGDAIRWLAGASFSVYVTHYPALHLLDAALPVMVGRDAALLLGALAVGLAFAQVFERPIVPFRNALRAMAESLPRGVTGAVSRPIADRAQ